MASTTHSTAASSAGSLRAAPSVIAGLTACGLLLALAFETGGYFPDAQLRAGTAAFAVLAVLLAVRPPRFGLSSPALLALAGLTGLAAWTGLSSRWSSMPDVALEDFQRCLLYLGLFGLGLVAAGSGRYSRHLLPAVLAVGGVVCAAALADRLWADAPQALDPFTGYRLAHPLSYWNALGTLGAMTLVLGAGLAGDPRTNRFLRGAAAGVAVLAGTAAYLSLSRGAWLAFFAGLAVLLVLSAHRLQLLMALAVTAAGLAVAVGPLAAEPALTDDPAAGAGQLAAAAGYRPVLLVAVVGTAVAQTLLASVRIAPWTRDQLAAAGRRLALPAAGVAVVVLLGAYLATAARVEGETARALTAAENWVERQWDEFMTPATFSASGTERLTTARGTRSDLYRVAIDGFEANPLLGDGAGGFQVRFAHDREVAEKVRDAHSLYLETLGELGLPGIAFLLALVGAIVWAVVLARVRTGAVGRSQAAAAGAAVSVWLVHAAVDWDWQVPALTGTALVLAAALFPTGRSTRRIRRRRKTTST